MPGEQQVAVVMEVPHDRHRDADPVQPLHDLGDGGRGLVVVHGHPDQLAPRPGQRGRLAHGRGHVGRVGVGHRLDDDRMARADRHAPDAGGDGATADAGRHGLEYNLGMPTFDGAVPPRAAITGVATYVPDRRVTNDDLAARLDTSDEWIVTRTGIRERRIGAPGETTSTMASAAVRRLLAARGLGPEEVDALIVATVTPDMMFPATACLVQDQVGMPRVWGFDLSAACSGFLYALTTGAQLVASGTHRRVIVA